MQGTLRKETSAETEWQIHKQRFPVEGNHSMLVGEPSVLLAVGIEME